MGWGEGGLGRGGGGGGESEREMVEGGEKHIYKRNRTMQVLILAVISITEIKYVSLFTDYKQTLRERSIKSKIRDRQTD